jgi:hypothetical protein
MATFFSDQVTAYNSTNPLFPSGFSAAQLATFQANVQYGKLRVLRFDWTAPGGTAAADIIQLARIPNGKVTLYPALSLFRNGAHTGASLSIGNAAYRDQLGAVVAASAISVLAATSINAAGTLTLVQAAPSTGVFSWESMNGVFLTGTLSAAGATAGQVLTGYFVIAVE